MACVAKAVVPFDGKNDRLVELTGQKYSDTSATMRLFVEPKLLSWPLDGKMHPLSLVAGGTEENWNKEW